MLLFTSLPCASGGRPIDSMQLRLDGHVGIGYRVKRVSQHQTSLMVMHSLKETHW